jgi:hypothetical protein
MNMVSGPSQTFVERIGNLVSPCLCGPLQIRHTFRHMSILLSRKSFSTSSSDKISEGNNLILKNAEEESLRARRRCGRCRSMTLLSTGSIMKLNNGALCFSLDCLSLLLLETDVSFTYCKRSMFCPYRKYSSDSFLVARNIVVTSKGLPRSFTI